jgi:predicted glycosyltransferase
MTQALFYLGHPAHFHLYKYAILSLKPDEVVVCIKSKDVLEKLLQESGISFINIDSGNSTKKKSKFRILLSFSRRMMKLMGIILKNKPRRLIGSAAELGVLGKMLNIPSFILFEDDFEKVGFFARIAGPSATYLICPDCCSAWKWNHKKIGYPSYHELAYLHPNHFNPDESRVEKIFDLSKRNFILRFSELGAYHDVGKTGISDELARRLISMLEKHGKVYITSERALSAEFEPYRIHIKASDIHHALYYADMFIGDSQTMTAEAAVLGTPAIRYNDFVGELSYLDDLEKNYQLTTGVRTSEEEKLFSVVEAHLSIKDLKHEWWKRRTVMLDNKSDFSKSIQWLLSCPPKDLNCLKKIEKRDDFV